VGSRAILDGCGKFHPHRYSILVLNILQKKYKSGRRKGINNYKNEQVYEPNVYSYTMIRMIRAVYGANMYAHKCVTVLVVLHTT
jgi:hypothetical protein